MWSKIRNFINDRMLIIAMVLGIILYDVVEPLTWVFPYFIFTMLFLTFSKIDIHSIKFSRAFWILLAVQVCGGIGLYFVLSFMNVDWGQAALISLFTPTATAAAVVTGMLGGSVGFLTAYTLFINIAVVIISPILFSFVGVNAELSFFHSVGLISAKVFPVLFLPLFSALLVRKIAPKVNAVILRAKKLNFYLWAITLVLVSGNTVSIIKDLGSGNIWSEILIAATSLALCLAQFKIGRKVGKYFGDKISFGQALGQKNTLLGIWLANTYLNPIVSLAPATYILWHNTINSWQLMKHKTEMLEHDE